MLLITYTRIQKQLGNQEFQEYINLLPNSMAKKITRFRRWQDAHLSLFGKLLLLDTLPRFGLPGSFLEQVRYSTFDKPYFEDTIDFNSSHSGNMVICIVSDDCNVGIDIEEIKAIPKTAFVEQWTDRELNIISKEPGYEWFYRLWTRKEAVIKADGRGLQLPLQEIEVMEDQVNLHGTNWYLNELDVLSNFIVHIATDSMVSGNLKCEERFF